MCQVVTSTREKDAGSLYAVLADGLMDGVTSRWGPGCREGGSVWSRGTKAETGWVPDVSGEHEGPEVQE